MYFVFHFKAVYVFFVPASSLSKYKLTFSFSSINYQYIEEKTGSLVPEILSG